MKILALDVGNSTGFAITGGPFGVYHMDHRPETPGYRWAQFTGWLSEMIGTHKVDCLVWERWFMRGGFATEFFFEAQGILKLMAYQCDCRVHWVSTTALKKWATGNHLATKPEMYEAIQRRYGEVRLELETDDVVDALWLLHYAEANLSPTSE